MLTCAHSSWSGFTCVWKLNVADFQSKHKGGLTLSANIKRITLFYNQIKSFKYSFDYCIIFWKYCFSSGETCFSIYKLFDNVLIWYLLNSGICSLKKKHIITWTWIRCLLLENSSADLYVKISFQSQYFVSLFNILILISYQTI